MYLSSHSFHIKHPYNRHHCCDSFDYLSSVQLVFMCASIGCNLLLLSCCVKIVCIIVAYPCISTHRCKGVYDFSSYFFHPRRVCHHSHIMFAFTIKRKSCCFGLYDCSLSSHRTALRLWIGTILQAYGVFLRFGIAIKSKSNVCPNRGVVTDCYAISGHIGQRTRKSAIESF